MMGMAQTDFFLSPVFCLHNGAVVVQRRQGAVTIGMLDVGNADLRRRLQKAVANQARHDGAQYQAEFVPLGKEEFNRHVSAAFAGTVPRKGTVTEPPPEQEAEPPAENEAAALLSTLLETAAMEDATDIHIEENAVRLRIRGELLPHVTLPAERRQALILRIKMLAHLNIVERRRAQDGHFAFVPQGDGHRVFVRVSCLPAVSTAGEGHGESVVLRVLDTRRMPLVLEQLGFAPEMLGSLRRLCSLANGLVLICGATGSGKSTTAGALLQEVRAQSHDRRKIISLEDPPEYLLEGVTQVQVSPGHGLDFAEALRRTFRQDPDVLFIGEIRDAETARTAVQAALTGHLVIATLHTAAVSQAVLRLCDLGAEPRIVNAVLQGIIVQELKGGVLSATIRVMAPEQEEEAHEARA